ncbi:ribonuclease 3-like protein 3 [Impatiens glandulifera]|uniref:ribonuclease 3-like protein 3 n=1 Tax=Impatiens glandulifera TaxID=253017 RepID=UPI001FB1725B|nr:ribonuclease 3-like protein 3 [Impatiens glandulifera]
MLHLGYTIETMDEQNEGTLATSLGLLCVDEINGNRFLSSFPNQLLEVEDIIGYEFKNRQLLLQAFTHSSCHNEDSKSYDRLEYIGDAVLNLLVARDDFFNYPKLSPGTLTMLRAANVDREKLARSALVMNLHKYLLHKKPLLDGQIEVFMEATLNYPIHSHGLIDAPKVLADLVESLVGAIFIDTNSSLEITWKVVRRILEPIITIETMGVHPMTKLYQMCQKNGLKVCFVDLWKDTGRIDVLVDDEFIGRGVYKSKKEIAINRAANDACNKLVERFIQQ